MDLVVMSSNRFRDIRLGRCYLYSFIGEPLATRFRFFAATTPIDDKTADKCTCGSSTTLPHPQGGMVPTHSWTQYILQLGKGQSVGPKKAKIRQNKAVVFDDQTPLIVQPLREAESFLVPQERWQRTVPPKTKIRSVHIRDGPIRVIGQS